MNTELEGDYLRIRPGQTLDDYVRVTGCTPWGAMSESVKGQERVRCDDGWCGFFDELHKHPVAII
jgi:hypothetical protein